MMAKIRTHQTPQPPNYNVHAQPSSQLMFLDNSYKYRIILSLIIVKHILKINKNIK